MRYIRNIPYRLEGVGRRFSFYDLFVVDSLKKTYVRAFRLFRCLATLKVNMSFEQYRSELMVLLMLYFHFKEYFPIYG